MNSEEILAAVSAGRTDFIFKLFILPDWKKLLHQGPVKLLQWLVYYDDLSAIRAILKEGGDLSSIDLNDELGNAAFFGHWKICDFLIGQGADVNFKVDKTAETPLHNATAKAGRPYYFYTVRLLVENGADVNAKTVAGIETGAFMRDVRTAGETPLHRAAAYADENIIQYLLDHGADKEARDAYGDTPLSWASRHLRPGSILAKLAFGEFRIGQGHIEKNTSDHGQGWGNSMDWNIFGDYLPENKS
ncbi:MAG: ankyrin repeat domain-containing protein [Bacteroidota bacterium]